MLFRIENFGPIKSFEMDLSKDMHLLYGKNSVGKSYAVGILYLFLKHLEEREIKFKEFVDLDIIVDNVDFGNQKIDFTKNIEISISNYLDGSTFSKRFQNSIQNSLDINEISEESKITIQTSLFTMRINFIKDRYKFSVILAKIISLSNPKKNNYNLYINDSFIKLLRGYTLNVNREIFYDIQEVLFGNNLHKLHNIYFLPASRSGLYPLWSSFGSIVAWISRYRFGMNKSIEIPPLSEYVSDYFLNISNAKNGDYNEYAKKVERDILGGSVVLDKQNSKIFFKPYNLETTLELPNSGSMVSEISPFVTFLKDVMTFNFDDKYSEKDLDELRKNFMPPDYEEFQEEFESQNKKNILIIEEPEAHLHPEAQVELMKIFVDMVQNSNIKLILTSHSDYMFSKLGNLILGKKIDYKKVAAYHLVMTDEGSVDAKDMKVSAEGILDYNFLDISEELYNERAELFEQFEEEEVDVN